MKFISKLCKHIDCEIGYVRACQWNMILACVPVEQLESEARDEEETVSEPDRGSETQRQRQ